MTPLQFPGFLPRTPPLTPGQVCLDTRASTLQQGAADSLSVQIHLTAAGHNSLQLGLIRKYS